MYVAMAAALIGWIIVFVYLLHIDMRLRKKGR